MGGVCDAAGPVPVARMLRLEEDGRVCDRPRHFGWRAGPSHGSRPCSNHARRTAGFSPTNTSSAAGSGRQKRVDDGWSAQAAARSGEKRWDGLRREQLERARCKAVQCGVSQVGKMRCTASSRRQTQTPFEDSSLSLHCTRRSAHVLGDMRYSFSHIPCNSYSVQLTRVGIYLLQSVERPLGESAPAASTGFMRRAGDRPASPKNNRAPSPRVSNCSPMLEICRNIQWQVLYHPNARI